MSSKSDHQSEDGQESDRIHMHSAPAPTPHEQMGKQHSAEAIKRHYARRDKHDAGILKRHTKEPKAHEAYEVIEPIADHERHARVATKHDPMALEHVWQLKLHEKKIAEKHGQVVRERDDTAQKHAAEEAEHIKQIEALLHHSPIVQ
mmetsp:Transcript_44198/g.58667  ORF Transcript_44198/g.58667 Transcript_44198/m.58667 type:complete len:147 (+) Transcript_44198:1026-1466(+)